MAYDRDTLNSMQMNLGLTPGGGAPPQPTFIPPAMAAQQMQAQASQQLAAGAAMTRLPAATPLGVFGQQFQNQFQMAQSQQSYNPYIAQALSGGGGYQGMPSPLMMTPPSTGIFRPPMQQQMGAIPPQQVAPLFPGGFTPQLPAPTFQTAWDRELQQREYRADKIYSMVAQTPRALGTMAGIGAGAFAGAKVGGAFGPTGGMLGAIGGGLAAGFSGVAGGVGDLAMLPMRPSLEVHGMGASLQRMSQQWVVAGPQLHQQGAGFTRSAAQDMATQIRSLASDRAFRAETGGQFNREDLMRMTETSGRAGLMDMDQSVDAVRTNLRQVARTVRRFMQLTGDPDVTSVIREMGQMRAYGMSVPEMERAAQNMKTFARAAGTSIQGLQAMGGLPGAMTYQGMQLSAGAGFEMGNYSLAAARQAVATGTFNVRELSMLGGVQGVAQRNVQAGAAMMSMPLFGAAIGSYGAQGWGVNYGNLAQAAGGGQGGLGAAGMVMGAVQNMGQAVARGGVGALAEYQLRQRYMQDDAARAMSPAQQMAMRFKMAQQTGQTLGFTGTAAFTVGSRAVFGDEVAEQMMMEARNPESFRAQARMMRMQNQEISRRQREDIINAAPGFADVLGYKLGIGAGPRGVMSALSSEMTNLGNALGRDNPILQYFEDKAARERGERINRVSPMIAIENEKQRQGILRGIGRGDLYKSDFGGLRGKQGAGSLGWVQSEDLMALAMPDVFNSFVQSQNNVSVATGIASIGGPVGVGVGIAGQLASTDFTRQAVLGSAVNNLSSEKRAQLLKLGTARASVAAATVRASQRGAEDFTKLDVSLSKFFDPDANAGTVKANAFLNRASTILAEKMRGLVSTTGTNQRMSEETIMRSLQEAGQGSGLSKAELGELMGRADIRGAAFAGAEAMGGAFTAGIAQTYKESAGAGAEFAGLSGKRLQEELAKREAGYEAMRGGRGEGDVGNRELIGLMRQAKTPWEHLALVRAAGGLSKEKEAELQKAFLTGGGKGEDWSRMMRQAEVQVRSGAISPNALQALVQQGKTQSLGQIRGEMETIQLQSQVGYLSSGLGAVGKAAGISGLEAYAGKGAELGESLIGRFGAEDLEKLRAAGKGSLAGLISAAQGTRGKGRAAAIGKVQAAFAQEGTLTAGATTESLAGAEGEQAAQNIASAKALEEVADSLKDAGFDKFKDGASDFVEGAKALRTAMESDTIRKALEGAK